MKSGINVAEKIMEDELFRHLYNYEKLSSSKLCFSVSHKNEDTDAAVEL